MTNQLGSPLPVKKGVSPNSLWLKEGNWATMLEYFLDRFPHIDRKNCEKRFSRGEVVTEQGEVLKCSSPYQANIRIYFYRELENEIAIPFQEEIIFQDNNIIVVDKPHFLPVAPSGHYLQETLIVRLRNKLKIDTIELCHRLDKETAGIVLLTKNIESRAAYQSLFAERKIEKRYLAVASNSSLDFPLVRRSLIVEGEPFPRMMESIGEPNSETHIKQLQIGEKKSLYELRPITGKKHQLRVHMAAIGIPIYNDPLYPKLKIKQTNDFRLPLQLLAKSIKFVDPLDGKEKCFTSRQELTLT